MMLLIISTFLSFLAVHSSSLGKLFVKWNGKLTSAQSELIQQKQSLQREQQQYNMVDNFAKYSKIQRKINSIDEKLEESKNNKNSFVLQMSLQRLPQIMCTMCLLYLTFYYRRTPLFKLPEYVELSPFNYFISYPNERNYVSFHFWVMSCNVVARLIKF